MNKQKINEWKKSAEEGVARAEMELAILKCTIQAADWRESMSACRAAQQQIQKASDYVGLIWIQEDEE